ncbi:MAG: SRPBCC family protein [Pseudomonadota bacterium]|nr:SRPBCC family protein [Pseudomonadota bacterium]
MQARVTFPSSFASLWHTAKSAILVLFGMLWCSAACAAEIEHIEVRQADLFYHVELTATTNVSRDLLYSLITDYPRYTEYSPRIIRSVLQPLPNTPDAVLTVIGRACIWWLCRDLVKISWVTETPPTGVEFEIVPGTGDFSAGHEKLVFVASGPGTVLHYQADLKIKFASRAPAFIGVWLIRKFIRSELEDTLAGIERAAALRSAD